jgi:hypothetical protein
VLGYDPKATLRKGLEAQIAWCKRIVIRLLLF